uniref:Secreted protein n=1 Tax=Steinernema glaseri TaxID=37863 RepID=A0A1I7ZD04_9BILA
MRGWRESCLLLLLERRSIDPTRASRRLSAAQHPAPLRELLTISKPGHVARSAATRLMYASVAPLMERGSDARCVDGHDGCTTRQTATTTTLSVTLPQPPPLVLIVSAARGRARTEHPKKAQTEQ